MKLYELTYLISPELKIEEGKELALEISALLENEGGFVIKIENPKPKNLSYQIKKQGAAFQVSLEFCSAPEKLRTFEEKIKKDTRILRYLIVVKKPPKKEKKREERIIKPAEIKTESPMKEPKKIEKKVELKDIEEKLEEILKE